MDDFVTWLNKLLEERGWYRPEAAKRGGISAAAYDQVINGYNKPGLKFCVAVAQAFDLSVDEVMIRAGVGDVHPHRFRHTFAIAFLRNGGGAYELQMALGHESMEMVRNYLSLAHSDLAAAHEKASPVTSWRL